MKRNEPGTDSNLELIKLFVWRFGQYVFGYESSAAFGMQIDSRIKATS